MLAYLFKSHLFANNNRIVSSLKVLIQSILLLIVLMGFAVQAYTIAYELPDFYASLTVEKIGQGSGNITIKIINPDGSISEPHALCKQSANQLLCGISTPGLNLKIDYYPDDDSYFAGFGEDCETEHIQLNSDKYCTIRFEPLPQLTIAIEGQGHVTEPTIPVDCHSNDNIPCVYPFTPGESLVLTPKPESYWLFEKWTGDCNTQGQVVLDDDKICTAHFKQIEIRAEPRQFKLTIEVIGGGQVFSHPSGIACGHKLTDCQATYPQDKEVYLTLADDNVLSQPNQLKAVLENTNHWHFEGWQGDCNDAGRVVLDEDKWCQAVFTLPHCTNENSLGRDPQGHELESHACFESSLQTDGETRANDSVLSNVEAKSLKLTADVITDPQHMGQAAQVYVIIRQKTSDSVIQYLVVDSKWHPIDPEWRVWDNDSNGVQLTQSVAALPEVLDVPIFRGDLSQERLTEFTVYLGYQLTENDHVFYNGIEPIHFWVEPIFEESKPPLSIDLIQFSAEIVAEGIQLSWETASERAHAAFILKRALLDQHDQQHIQLTEWIPAQGHAVHGASYRFKDNTVLAGQRYLYWLEGIDVKGIHSVYRQYQVIVEVNH